MFSGEPTTIRSESMATEIPNRSPFAPSVAFSLLVSTHVVSSCDGSALPTIDRGGGVYSVSTGRGLRSFLGQPLPVRWALLEDVDPAGDTLRFEAHARGAALIERGEGA